MSRVNAPTSNDINLSDLLRRVDDNSIQLPEFQRGWTWDDFRIRSIIASITESYPMGAIMQLKYGGDSVRFKYRVIEGAEKKDITPEFLILDGQQRLTSIYGAAYSSKPVLTKNDNGRETKRYYYLDINKCLDKNTERLDAVISVPESRIKRENFDRDIAIDLSSRELEYQNEMFPVNIIFDSREREYWADGYKKFHGYDAAFVEKYNRFRSEVIEAVTDYRLPVITLGADTPKEAVCKVFENVNTGGVTLTVFELVTASFAADDFNLREDWEKCKEIIRGQDSDIMNDVDEVSFLTAITLLASYMKSDAVTSCKKKDVLALKLNDYMTYRDSLLEGYKMARKFLLEQCIFRQRDMPYTSQITPLAAICAALGWTVFNRPQTGIILSKWFWCGIFGEMYGGSTDTRYVYDIEDVTAEIAGRQSFNRTVNASFFQASRLLSLQTRNSAAYKGIMALLYKKGCRDFISGTIMGISNSNNDKPDIHHIFPEKYCKEKNYPREKWNSIINKTPLLPESNRFIGGYAPSVYSANIMKAVSMTADELKARVESNLINYEAFIADDFEKYFIDRARQLLSLIESATGRAITDKASEQTIKLYGQSLA